MDNQLTSTNRINNQLSSLRGAAAGLVEGERASRERVDRFAPVGFGEAAAPISTLSGLATIGLRRAGLYTPADSSSSRENSVVK